MSRQTVLSFRASLLPQILARSTKGGGRIWYRRSVSPPPMFLAAGMMFALPTMAPVPTGCILLAFSRPIMGIGVGLVPLEVGGEGPTASGRLYSPMESTKASSGSKASLR